jgi:hypothetical protein
MDSSLENNGKVVIITGAAVMPLVAVFGPHAHLNL